MIIDETNFLDWNHIIINEVVGSFMILLILGIIIIAILSVSNRVSFSNMIILIIAWCLICITLVYSQAVLMLVVLLFAFSIIYIIGKVNGWWR